MKDGFDLAREQMQAHCAHLVVLRREPQWTPSFIEEFPTYTCLSCQKPMRWWGELDRGLSRIVDNG